MIKEDLCTHDTRSNEEAIKTTSNIMFPVHTPILSMLNDRFGKNADKFSKQIKNCLEAENVLSGIENKDKKSNKKYYSQNRFF